jgi:sterol desaturase/sphingolipid hydroxylase (fatty acid hydroxylase superfamily)
MGVETVPVNDEILIRLGFFFGVLLLMVGWEALAPRRILRLPRKIRWPGNLGIVLLNSLTARFLFPLMPVGLAFFARERGWGLLNQIDLPSWMAIVSALVLMDFAIYLQHVVFHAFRILWRVHRMHHTDLDYDVTTGLRFHPLEIFLSLLLKLAVVALVGPGPAAVVIFEVLLNATSMFNHGNVRISTSVDRVIRLFVVTPDMHRVHHSVITRETDSNYGFNLPWWDRLFGTYREQPVMGHEGMTVGLDRFRDPKMLRLHWLLAIPFLRTPPEPDAGPD